MNDIILTISYGMYKVADFAINTFLGRIAFFGAILASIWAAHSLA